MATNCPPVVLDLRHQRRDIRSVVGQPLVLTFTFVDEAGDPFDLTDTVIAFGLLDPLRVAVSPNPWNVTVVDAEAGIVTAEISADDTLNALGAGTWTWFMTMAIASADPIYAVAGALSLYWVGGSSDGGGSEFSIEVNIGTVGITVVVAAGLDFPLDALDERFAALVGPSFPPGVYYAAPQTGYTTAIPDEARMRGGPLVCGRNVTLTKIGLQVTVVGTAGAVVRLGLYRYRPDTDDASLLVDAGTIDGTSATYQERPISVDVQAGWVLVPVAAVQGAAGTRPTVRMAFPDSSSSPFFGANTGVLASTVVGAGLSVSGVSGALPSTVDDIGANALITSALLPRVVLCS